VKFYVWTQCFLFRFRFANDMVYIGLSYYGPSLGQNQYLSFLLSSVVEVPSCLVCWLLMDRWGRRWPLCLAMTLSGISCIVTVTLPPGKLHGYRSVEILWLACILVYFSINWFVVIWRVSTLDATSQLGSVTIINVENMLMTLELWEETRVYIFIFISNDKIRFSDHYSFLNIPELVKCIVINTIV